MDIYDDLRESRLNSNIGSLRSSSLAATERFGSIVDGHAARTPSIIDTKYKNLADLKEQLHIDVIDSKNQYTGDKGKEIQKYLKSKVTKNFIPLRKTGFDMAGDDTVFELAIILDSTGSMGPWIQRARETIN